MCEMLLILLKIWRLEKLALRVVLVNPFFQWLWNLQYSLLGFLRKTESTHYIHTWNICILYILYPIQHIQYMILIFQISFKKYFLIVIPISPLRFHSTLLFQDCVYISIEREREEILRNWVIWLRKLEKSKIFRIDQQARDPGKSCRDQRQS